MEDKKITCPYCNESFDTIQEHALHHARIHPNEPMDDEKTDLKSQFNKNGQEESM